MALGDEFKLRDWRVVPERNVLSGKNGEIHVRRQAMRVLVLLAERAGEVVSRDDFSDAIWAPAVVSENSLNRCVSELRRALGEKPSTPDFIETVPKQGYRLAANPEPLHPASEIRTPAGSAAPGQKSIAVLPLDRIGAGGDESLTEGLHNELLTSLSLLGELQVISATSVRRYSSTTLAIGEIAAELGVAWILEGSVQQAAGRVRVNVQLVHAATDHHHWARTYEQPFSTKRLFAIQSEIAQDVARSLRARISPSEQRGIDQVPTRDIEAYTRFVEARTRFNSRTESAMRRAVELFRLARDTDPEFAQAWSGLADALTLLHDYGYATGNAVLTEAREAIDQALELNPELAEPHASLGAWLGAVRDFQPAIRALKRAIELRPGYAQAHNWLSWVSALSGDAEQALDSGLEATGLDPYSVEALSNLALGHLCRQQFEPALDAADRVAELQPDFTTATLYSAIAAWHLGQFESVREQLHGMHVHWAGSGAQCALALAEVRLGNRAAAKALLERMDQSGDPFEAGLTALALGDTDAATARWHRLQTLDYFALMVLQHDWFPDLLTAGAATESAAALRELAASQVRRKPD